MLRSVTNLVIRSVLVVETAVVWYVRPCFDLDGVQAEEPDLRVLPDLGLFPFGETLDVQFQGFCWPGVGHY